MDKRVWTAQEVKDLHRLLEKVKADGGWWPDERSFNLAHGCMSAWALELVIYKHWWMRWRIFRRWRKVLLTEYVGGIKEFRKRRHIPGGYGTPKDRTLQATCSRVAVDELKVDVRVVRTFPLPALWPPRPSRDAHPYGRPLSIFTLVRPRTAIRETDTCRFFGRNDLPDDLLPVHRRFLKEFIF